MNPLDVQKLATGEQPALRIDYGISMEALISEFKSSQSYVEQNTRDFPQLDQLVDAVPLNFDSDVPFVGDTTLAGLVRSIPRNSLQQLPVFSVAVNGTENSITALLCTYFLKAYTFNEDTFGKGLLSTLQIGAEQALTHGYAPFLAAKGAMYDDFGTTMRLLFYGDTSPERGITDANESGFHYVVAHLPRSKVVKIRNAAANNQETSWDVERLDQLLDMAPKPTNYSQYASDPRKNAAAEAANETYEIVTRYETGRGGKIVTFCPDVSEGPLRVIKNKSKWGYPRVQYLVIDPAALTPFGISRVRLASPNQNLMNIYYGNVAAMLLLNSKPPILKKGRFSSPVQLKQGAVWETADTQATAELKNLDNGSLQWFDKFHTQFAGQIQNIMGGETTTVQAATKNAYGNTGPGVKKASEVQDISTNQITKILENFLRQYALVSLDTLLCEQEGEDMVIVDDETKNKINAIEPGAVGADNKIKVVWEEFYASIEKWSVKIIVSLSKDELDEKKRGDLQDMLTVLGQNAQILGPEAVQKVKEITDMLMQDKAPLVKTGPEVPAVPSLIPAPPTQPEVQQ